MTHKTPKELEKVPIVFGFELKVVIMIIVATMLFIFLMTVNFLLALLFPVLVAIYIYFSQKFKKKGELLNYLKYSTGSKVIKFDKTIEELLNNKH